MGTQGPPWARGHEIRLRRVGLWGLHDPFDEATQACKLLVSEVGNQSITTIEGLSENWDHPVQQAWLEHDVSQCGYCQPGQIMRAAALLKKIPNPTDIEIQNEMNRNICRCGTYIRINAAIKTAAKILQNR
jgi:isoquinoline 1-oxidoreductase alpha subunit